MEVIKRVDIIKKLDAWRDARESTLSLHMWADKMHMSSELIFEDMEGENSVSQEVLAELSMLDMNLLIQGDIPIFKAFLNSSVGQFEESYVKFVSDLQNIDHEQRKRKLKNTEPYVKYCVD